MDRVQIAPGDTRPAEWERAATCGTQVGSRRRDMYARAREERARWAQGQVGNLPGVCVGGRE